MKRICTLYLWLLCLLSINPENVAGQCPGGYNSVTLNWDYLDYLVWSGSYSNGYLTSANQAYTQHFSFGANRLTIDVPISNFSISGENTSHTGDNGSYAEGADVKFSTFNKTPAAITLTFEQEVRNLKFSIYDLDQKQRMTVSAVNEAGSAKTVTLSKANSSSGTVFSNNPGNNPLAQGVTNNYTNSDNKGTVNIDIDGPVKTISLTFSNALNDIWLSDITACSPGSFPENYYEVSRPVNGSPAYVLHALENKVYALDPATGESKFLFSDNTVPNDGYINSLAYDPYKHILYYVYTLTHSGFFSRSPGGSKVLRKYDFNTETASTVLNDITSIGIPVSSDIGVEEGGAAFYNGALYLGIKTTDDDKESDREAVIWRIDFNASNVPYRASQVFAVPVDNGSGTLLHEFGDLVINNGVLYDFDGAVSDGNQTDIYQFNLLTGSATVDDHPSFIPGQTAIDWSGNIFQVYSYAAFLTPAYVASYNPSNGNLSGTRLISTSSSPWLTLDYLGDAAEAFRPRFDYGDAPASYTTDVNAPAAHESSADLHLGSTFDDEWNATVSELASDDGNDEDGIGQAPSLNANGTITYTISGISVYNNTGSNATLAAWLDYNFNGVFDAGEAVVITVPSRSYQQSVTLSWNNINVPNTTALRTFLRLRITSSSNNMNAADMNGWLPNGEVEDFPVTIGVVLPEDLLSFSANLDNDEVVNLRWRIADAQLASSFDILRSADNKNWTTIGTVTCTGNGPVQQYTFNDKSTLNGISYYRLRIHYQSIAASKLSSSQLVKIIQTATAFKLWPNPATEQATVQLTSAGNGQAILQVIDKGGKTVLQLKQQVVPGVNDFVLSNLGTLPPGVYTVRTTVNNNVSTTQMIITH